MSSRALSWLDNFLFPLSPEQSKEFCALSHCCPYLIYCSITYSILFTRFSCGGKILNTLCQSQVHQLNLHIFRYSSGLFFLYFSIIFSWLYPSLYTNCKFVVVQQLKTKTKVVSMHFRTFPLPRSQFVWLACCSSIMGGIICSYRFPSGFTVSDWFNFTWGLLWNQTKHAIRHWNWLNDAIAIRIGQKLPPWVAQFMVPALADDNT